MSISGQEGLSTCTEIRADKSALLVVKLCSSVEMLDVSLAWGFALRLFGVQNVRGL